MIKKILNYLKNNSLYRNSIYLITGTFLMSGFGFFFWMINARLFTPEQIGLATTIISVMGTITSFSLLGLNISLIRYLPKSKRKSDMINTCFSSVALTTITISTFFLINIRTFSSKLLFIKENQFYAFFFIFFMVFSSSSALIESIFISFKNSKFVFIKNTIFSILKLIFPFFLITLGAYGIFSSWMIALMVGFGISFFLLKTKFNYQPKLVFHISIVRDIGKYSFGNYIVGFIGDLPIMLLPVMILNRLNAETAAYYYMAMMVANVLFIIPRAVSSTLFAEGSNNEKGIKGHVKKAIKIISLLLIPGILITFFFGKYILLMFGNEYSEEGFKFLQLLAFSGILVAVNSVFTTLFRVRNKVKELIFISFIGTLSILWLSYLLLDKGLIGVGLAWIIGQGIIGVFYLGLVKRKV